MFSTKSLGIPGDFLGSIVRRRLIKIKTQSCVTIVFSQYLLIISLGPKGPSTWREIVAPFISLAKKLLSIFIDESGDDGFGKEGSSEFYFFTLVFHDQNKEISGNIEKIAHLPVFHAGPILRKEPPFENEDPEKRKKLFQSIFVFASGLPVSWKTFCYEKKMFPNYGLLQRRMFRDLKDYLYAHEAFFSAFEEVIVYYDKGQHNLFAILNLAFGEAPFSSSFHSDVKPDHYRLFQVADFVSTIRLLEAKRRNHTISEFENGFIDDWHFKNVYLRTINRKELN